MATMKMLVEKYPDGYEGWERENEDLIVMANQERTAHPNEMQIAP